MGNENSLSKENRENKKEVDNFNSINLISNENDSDYNGVKTCIDNSDLLITNNSNASDENSVEKEKEKEKSKIYLSTECSTGNLRDKEDCKIPTKFEWKEGGNVVYVVGSFNNWSQWFIMNKVNGKSFELILDLPLGNHQYKFIVDNVWRYSKNYPTIKDNNGNINNLMDNSIFIQDLLYTRKSSSDEEEKEQKTYSQKNKKEDRNGKFSLKDSSLNSNESQKNEDTFGSYYSSKFVPPKDDMNLDANNTPKCYTSPFYLHNFHVIDYKTGKNDFVFDKNKKYETTYSSYSRTMNLPPHINV